MAYPETFDPDKFGQQFQQHLNNLGIEMGHNYINLGHKPFIALIPTFRHERSSVPNFRLNRKDLRVHLPDETGMLTDLNLTQDYNDTPQFELHNIISDDEGRDPEFQSLRWQGDYEGPEHLARTIKDFHGEIRDRVRRGEWVPDVTAREDTQRLVQHPANAVTPEEPFLGEWAARTPERPQWQEVHGRISRNFQFRRGQLRWQV